VSGPAVRSRLLGLRARLEAARRGRELLEKKREVLLRDLLRRAAERERLRLLAGEQLGEARRRMRDAWAEIGRAAAEGASLAQPRLAGLVRSDSSLVGIRLPRLRARLLPFRPRYGPGGTAETLDRAGVAFASLLSPVLHLAEEDASVQRLEEGLRKTVRLLNGLEKLVLPELEREIRAVSSTLEEEERDEAFRRRRQRRGARSS
jgi:V/A-type H+-transporting ATPase subunit D